MQEAHPEFQFDIKCNVTYGTNNETDTSDCT
jgi:hypothetical protein